MSRIRRSYCPEMLMLESRQLLTAELAPAPPMSMPPMSMPPMPMPAMVSFASPMIVVSQQSDSATISLTRNTGNGSYRGPVQVRVVSQPSSADGVNLLPIDQIVSFPADTSGPFVPTPTTTFKQAQEAYAAQVQTETITVPIIPGAPNPGEVYVWLDLQAVDGSPNVSLYSTAWLQIKAAADVTPPTIIGSRVTRRGVELTFSEPLDPASAQNVHNYGLTDFGHINASQINAINGDIPMSGAPPVKRMRPPKLVRVRSAVYDAATHTVTLIPSRSVAHSSMIGVMGSNVSDTSGNLLNGDANNYGMNMFTTTIYPPHRTRR